MDDRRRKVRSERRLFSGCKNVQIWLKRKAKSTESVGNKRRRVMAGCDIEIGVWSRENHTSPNAA
ncbi:unnamed protein product [Dovyalis caffra]|uniref:MADS-box domain-containing protein n=1 Tax=Dovyalis caffra TaxID=77055 RepID=A0AAV1RBD2_9ROSI|nr:unnamed protein product [Dovyalis caffra]